MLPRTARLSRGERDRPGPHAAVCSRARQFRTADPKYCGDAARRSVLDSNGVPGLRYAVHVDMGVQRARSAVLVI